MLSMLFLDTLRAEAREGFYSSIVYSHSYDILNYSNFAVRRENNTTDRVYNNREIEFDIPIVCIFDNNFVNVSNDSYVIDKNNNKNVVFYLNDELTSFSWTQSSSYANVYDCYLYYGDTALYHISGPRSGNTDSNVDYRRGFTINLPSLLNADDSGCLMEFHLKGRSVYTNSDKYNILYGGTMATIQCNIAVESNFLRSSSNTVITSESNSQEILEESREQTETGHNIFNSITDFFGNFFSNLIGVFVPEDGFFSDWFNRLNTLLSDKLGMLYAPFDMLISTLQSIYSADSSSAGIPFPGIKWGDTWLIEPFTFTFDSLGSDFSDLREKVYFGTDTVLIFTFLILLQKKVRLILEGHE